ncbi:hypothetical protein NS228_12860 [Methylobacterium indicum]|uniref:hypothetical protein n=1 Tax=Methylobacterium indicum TaxID=1775910 RepID=UPI000734D7BA|nr:hypothetical protein [Methylobacterium indicum]KTS30476.1 hypothetical protein NS229_16240 [Methylobacterium indicum]KTS40030.1 hypothetical protein NS228_12860 [Methylobacterium indicum]KTS53634.1 hypothetical protein NS230_04970 [Methylobacterium indicum]
MKDKATMSNAAAGTRRYVKLTEAQWVEVEALWAAGAATLTDLSQRYGITERGLQARFARRGIEKGAGAKALAVEVTARVQAEQAADVEDLVVRAKLIRDTTVSAAEKVERMIVASLDAADADPGQIYAAAAKIKLLMNAASTLERIHTLKKVALGINDDGPLNDDLPVLVLRDLSSADIERMRQDQDDAEIIDTDENDVIVEEK